VNTTETKPILRHANAEHEVRACFSVMKELRPDLRDEADFMNRVGRMRHQSYRLLAVWDEDCVIALAGYRTLENFVYGRFLYVDDLIVTAGSRGRGWGARLLEELTSIARYARCMRLVLDTGVSNALAQRFYFRQGLLTGAMGFSKFVAGKDGER
jgi:ribosomal protein S18 acetylase RimI-like enzyme